MIRLHAAQQAPRRVSGQSLDARNSRRLRVCSIKAGIPRRRQGHPRRRPREEIARVGRKD